MVSTLRTEALSDILYSVAIFVSYGTQGPYESNREFQDMQGAINDYILSLKKEEDENKIDPYPLEKEKELVSYI